MTRIGKCLLPAAVAGLVAHALQSAAAFDSSREYVEAPRVAARYPDPDVSIATPAFQARQARLHQPGRDCRRSSTSYSRRSPDLRVRIIGRSQEARAIPLLIFARPRPGDGGDLAKNGKPTVLIIGQQHGNEPAGGEAALALAAELTSCNAVGHPRPDQRADRAARQSGRGLPFRARPEEWRRRQPRPPARGYARRTRAGRVVRRIPARRGARLSRVRRQAALVREFQALQGYDALIQYATVSNLPPAIDRAWTHVSSSRCSARSTPPGCGLLVLRDRRTTCSDPRSSMGGVVPDTGRNIAGLRNASAS